MYYEWSNLLPACHDCNTVAGGKGTKFPINGNRVSEPKFLEESGKLDKQACYYHETPLVNEKPYLLHPEYDNPEEYLNFKINDNFEGIDIEGIDEGSRGFKTIDICNLNREPLRLNRQEYVVDKIIEDIRETLKNCKDDRLSI